MDHLYTNKYLLLFIVTLNIWGTLQTPFNPSYTNELLRRAKSAEMFAFINTEYNSCDDFYQYACGNWKRTHPATELTPKTSYLGQLSEFYKYKCINMMKSERHNDKPLHAKLKDFFESCSNEVALAQSGLDPVHRIVRFTGGWPKVISTFWYEDEYDWLHVIAEMRRKLGVDIFIGLEIIPDFQDIGDNRIKVGAPKLQLGSRDAYLNPSPQRQEYLESIRTKLEKYYPDMPSNWANEVAMQVIQVETDLAKGLPESSSLTLQQTTRKRNPTELKDAYGKYVDLSRYLTLIFNETIQGNVYETPEDYMSNLIDVIKRTPKLTIANYTMWRVLEAFDFAGAINDEHNDNWCIERIIEYFPKQLEDMFHHHLGAAALHEMLLSVWKDIKTTFKNELHTSPHLNWMTRDTRQKSIQKLDRMSFHVEQYNYTELERELAYLRFDKHKYYDNLLQILQWHTERQLAQLHGKPILKFQNKHELPTYELQKNQINVPIVFLQSHFLWDAAYPHVFKYSSLGVLLAQQMLRGFDAQGRQYDLYGNRRSWWDSTSEVAYGKRAECIVNQYENQKFQGNNVFEDHMVSDIITFNGALAIAYRMYNFWKNNYSPENMLILDEILPNMDYKPLQLFFLGFSQIFCADYEKNITEFMELPEHLKVNGALSNFENFPNTFNCILGTKLNPEEKCTIF